ncbi:ATP-binding protein [Myxosarcina sp. GI1]|uniref:sensor histidine kinase n=1 Tax=Myxosarcina sp. GI1 TaxID=1541065 RepID=UPI00069008B9|nr:ATP-binding protein [Myxosarcina sp. GI1]
MKTSAKKIELLILHNSHPIADSISSMLDRATYKIEELQIDTGEDFIACLNSNVDLVLLNCCHFPLAVKPALDLLASKIAVPTIVIDSKPNIANAIRAIKAGAVEYLPITELERLPTAIEQTILAAKNHDLSSESLSEADRQLQKLITQNADGIIVVDRRGIVRFVNQAALTLLERTEAEILGDCLGFPVMGEDYLEVDIPSRDKGIPRVAQMRVSEIQWQETTAYLVSLRDITKLKRIEAERAELLERAQAANRAKDEFLAVLSHELRTPLNPIVGWAQILSQNDLSQKQIQKGVEIIHRNAMLQAQLVGDILDISRIISGKLKMQTTVVNLTDIIEDALETVRFSAQTKLIKIVTKLESTEPVRGDEMRLQQIVWNLLSNAIKFTPREGKITISLKSVGTDAQFQVEDTGKGIETDFLPYIFEYFRQADSSRSRSTGGLGLGLAIAHYLAELHGGTLTAYSEGKDKGAIFTFTLPTVVAET